MGDIFWDSSGIEDYWSMRRRSFHFHKMPARFDPGWDDRSDLAMESNLIQEYRTYLSKLGVGYRVDRIINGIVKYSQVNTVKALARGEVPIEKFAASMEREK
jgi:hypothetical protein